MLVLTASVGVDLLCVVGSDPLVTEHSCEASLTDAIPGVDTEAIDASLVGLAPVTVGSLPARAAPALSGLLAEAICGVTSITANGTLAIWGQISRFADAVHGLVTISIDTVRRADADVTVLTSPALMTAVKFMIYLFVQNG